MSLVFDNCSFAYSRSGRVVLDRFDLELGRGRAILLGPNGAGKSTLLSLAASALLPRRGQVRYGGLSSSNPRERKRYRARVAWMPQSVAPVPGCRAREQVALAGWLKGLSRSEAWQQAGRALEVVRLAELSGVRVDRLSGGQRARVGLAQALVHDAEVIVLDEPTASLDPAQRENFLSTLHDVADGRVVLVSTHDVNEIATAFDRVLVIDRAC